MHVVDAIVVADAEDAVAVSQMQMVPKALRLKVLKTPMSLKILAKSQQTVQRTVVAVAVAQLAKV
jgi:hypothetical protein